MQHILNRRWVLSTVLDDLVDKVFRAPCALCGGSCAGPRAARQADRVGAGLICTGCERDLPHVMDYGPVMPGPNAHQDFAVVAPVCICPFDFSFPVNTIVHRLKFGGQREWADVLARYMWAALEPRAVEDLILLPVPLHPARLRQRGYNQAVLLAQALSRLSGFQLWDYGVRRIRPTRSQRTLDAAARARNVEGCFEVVAPLPGARLLLVDDVLTTGATTRSLLHTLVEAGAATPWVITAARA